MKKTVYGIGYLGENNIKVNNNNIRTKAYQVWKDMLARCYSSSYQIKYPTYIGCSVEESWHNYENFLKWFNINYREGLVLDKDVLIKGNKIYSEKTCIFITPQINSLFMIRLKDNNLPRGISIKRNKYQATIKKYSKDIYIGIYDTIEEASIAYKKERLSYFTELVNNQADLLSKETYLLLSVYTFND